MKIFVTGATGFIGSNFLNVAHDNGTQIIAQRRNENSKPRLALKKNPQWLTKNLDDVKKVDFKNVDVVVHLAAHSMTPPYDSLEKCLYWNLFAPLNLINEAIEAGVKKIIVAGSCFEYGESGENYDYIPVNAPLNPTLSYSASKAAASIAFCQLAREKKIELMIHRIFHVYGPGEAENRLWPSLKRAAENNQDLPMTLGEQIRDFIAVEDVALTIWESCKEKMIPGKPIIRNMGSGEPKTIREFSEYWWKKWDAKGRLLFGELPYREGEVMRYVPEI